MSKKSLSKTALLEAPNLSSKLFLTKETLEDTSDVNKLITASFDKEIKQRPVYGFRVDQHKIHSLCRIALDPQGEVKGTIRYYKASLMTRDGRKTSGRSILLGPLSVSPAYRGKGLAHQLVSFTLAEAQARGYGPCFVVGDPKIYRKHGFCNATSLSIRLPGQEDLRRFLVSELKNGQITAEMQDTTLVPFETDEK